MRKAFLGVSKINQETDKSTTIEDCVELCEKSGWEYRWLILEGETPLEIHKNVEYAIKTAESVYKGFNVQILDLYTWSGKRVYVADIETGEIL